MKNQNEMRNSDFKYYAAKSLVCIFFRNFYHTPKFNTNQKFLTEIDKLSQNKPRKGRKYTKSESEKGILVLLIFWHQIATMFGHGGARAMKHHIFYLSSSEFFPWNYISPLFPFALHLTELSFFPFFWTLSRFVCQQLKTTSTLNYNLWCRRHWIHNNVCNICLSR